MDRMGLKSAFRLTIVILISFILFSCASKTTSKSGNFSAQITDKPLTFCNPINVNVGSQRVGRMGEPVVVLYKDDYYLFTGSGYYYSDNMRDWTLVNAPNYPRGVPSAGSIAGRGVRCRLPPRLRGGGQTGRHDCGGLF